MKVRTPALPDQRRDGRLPNRRLTTSGRRDRVRAGLRPSRSVIAETFNPNVRHISQSWNDPPKKSSASAAQAASTDPSSAAVSNTATFGPTSAIAG